MEYRRDQQTANTGHKENAFHNQRAAHQSAERKAHDGDHGNERILESMTQENAALLQALGAGGTDIVIAQDLQQAGAHVAHQTGRGAAAQCQSRHNHTAQARNWILEDARIAGSRKPFQLHGEEPNHQDAKPEIRYRQADHADQAGSQIPAGIDADGGQNAQRHGNDRGDDDGHDSQFN